MNTGGFWTSDKRNLSRWDIDALQSSSGKNYGWLQGTLGYGFSINHYTWYTTSLGYGAVSAPSSVTSAPNYETSIWAAYLNIVSGVPYVQYTWGNSSGDVSPGTLYESWDRPAVAKGFGTVLIARTAYETTSQAARKIRWCISNNGGSSWTCNNAKLNSGADILTRRDGLTAAYDPKTDRFIIGYRADDNSNSAHCDDGAGGACDELQFYTVARSGSTSTQRHSAIQSGGTGIKSIAAPGVACLDYGSNNCVIAWGSITSQACLHWGHAAVNGSGDVVLANDKNQCYYMYGTPFVSADYGTSYPFRLSFRQGGPTVYVLRKTSSETASWQNLTSFSVWSQPYGASIGNYYNGTIDVQRAYFTNPNI